MENNKKSIGRIIIIVLLIIFIALAAGIAINMSRMRRNFRKMAEGSFVYKDGVETYMEYGQVVIDKLVEVDGKIYYVDGDGHKVKDTWAIIDNDGHYGYFGNMGDLVLNKIRTIQGKDYYFDENGVLYQDRTEKKIKVIDGVEYIANKNGELRLATDVVAESEEETAVESSTAQSTTVQATTAAKNTQATTVNAAAQQAAAQQAAAQAAAAQAAAAQQAAAQAATAQAAAAQAAAQVSTEAPFANAIDISGNLVPNEFGGPGVVGGNSNGSAVTPTGVVSGKGSNTSATTVTGHADEVKIQKTEKITETYEGDDYDCKITLIKPIMIGTSDEETENMNACIDEIMDAWMDEIMGLAGEYDEVPKSITFTSATLTSTTKSKAVITLSGTLKPKTGSSKTLKYKITYDRTDANADITKTSSS